MTPSALSYSLSEQRAIERGKRARGELPEAFVSEDSLSPYGSESDGYEDELDVVAAPRLATEPHRESSRELAEASGDNEEESEDSCSDATSEGEHHPLPAHGFCKDDGNMQKPCGEESASKAS